MGSEQIVLASASPRRKTLLAELTEDFTVFPVDVDESVRPGGENPVEYTKRLAADKADRAAENFSDGIIIGSDTIVTIDGAILGKPIDTDEAKAMLRQLSGRTHTVVTAFCVLNASTGRRITRAVETRVTFRELSDKDIEDYIRTNDYLDKAGAYAIQEGGSAFVAHIEGSYTNVVGLPVDEVAEALEEMTGRRNSPG